MGTWLKRNTVGGAWLLWVGIMAGIAIAAYLAPRSHTVYDVYSLASLRWWQGRDIYAVEIEHYRYSPLFAIAITPLAMLPDSLGTPLWKILNCAVYALGVGALARRLVPAALSRVQVAVFFLLALPLSLHGMFNGQANLMMVGAILLGLSAAVDDRWNRAAGWLAVATLIKAYPLALALLLGALYTRRFPWRYAVAMAVGLLLPFACQRPVVVAGEYASWFHHLGDSPSIMRERMRALDHLLLIYGHPITPRTFTLLGLLGGLVVCGLCLRTAWQGASRRELLTGVFTHFVVWVILFGPATECCTYAVMAPVIAWALVETAGQRQVRGRRLALVVSLLLMMGRLSADPFGTAVRDFANNHGGQPLGALLFLACWLTRPHRVTTVVAEVAPSLRAAA